MGDGLNLYAYCFNNPTILIDPEGLCAVKNFFTEQGQADFWAGFGDTITFGGTKWIRDQWLDAFGWDDAVNYNSILYETGGYAGETVGLAIAGAGVVRVGGKALRIAKGIRASKNSPIVIGENMKRVNEYARKTGGNTIDDWLAGRKWTRELNDEFISTMKAQRRQIKDIGPDFNRRLQNRIDPTQGRGPSSVYGTERRELLNSGNYERLYERTGKYQGGVPGFDY